MSALLTGAADTEGFPALRAAVLRNTIAGLVPMSVDGLAERSWPALVGRKEITDLSVLLCVDQRCLQPVHHADDFARLLKQLAEELKQ